MLSVWPCAVWLHGQLRAAVHAQRAAEDQSLRSASTASASLHPALDVLAYQPTASASEPTMGSSGGLASKATGSSSSVGTASSASVGTASSASAGTAGPSVSGDASTLGPYSYESDSLVSTALSWATAAEESEALDPARLGASPSSAGILRGHLDFGIADGAYETPVAVFDDEELAEAVFPFRNASQHRLLLSAELCLTPEQQRHAEQTRRAHGRPTYRPTYRGVDRGPWKGRRRDRSPVYRTVQGPPGPSLVPPDVLLEPESRELGPGEAGRLRVFRRNDFRAYEHDGVYVELRSQAEGETRPQVVEIPLLRQTKPLVRNEEDLPALFAPHSCSRRLPYAVRTTEEAVWVRLQSSARVEQVGGDRGWQLLLRDQPLEGHFRLAAPLGRPLESAEEVSIGEAIFAGDDDVRELGELREEERRSRAQDLGDLAYFSRPPEQGIVKLSASVRFSHLAGLELIPASFLCLLPPPGAAGLRLRNLDSQGTLVWSATAPQGFLCRPAAGLLEPAGSALLEVLAAEGAEARPPLLLAFRSAWCPAEERAVAEEAPADFIESQELLCRLHHSVLSLLPGVASL